MALTIVETRAITGGVDTHADVHVAAALDPIGGLLGVKEFPATMAGYGRLLSWLSRVGTVCLVGIEGTGSYGAGLARHITRAGIRVSQLSRRPYPAMVAGNSLTPSSPPMGSSAAATCTSAWVSTPPVIARVSTMVNAIPFLWLKGWHAPA